MNIKHFSIATLVGAVALFLIGFLFYTVFFAAFFESNVGAAGNIMRDDSSMVMPVLFLGNIATAALLTYIFIHWAGISTFLTGLKAGLIIGFLMAAGFDLVQYSTSTIMNLKGAIGDIVVYSVMLGLTGGIIGAILGKLKK